MVVIPKTWDRRRPSFSFRHRRRTAPTLESKPPHSQIAQRGFRWLGLLPRQTRSNRGDNQEADQEACRRAGAPSCEKSKGRVVSREDLCGPTHHPRRSGVDRFPPCLPKEATNL